MRSNEAALFPLLYHQREPFDAHRQIQLRRAVVARFGKSALVFFRALGRFRYSEPRAIIPMVGNNQNLIVCCFLISFVSLQMKQNLLLFALLSLLFPVFASYGYAVGDESTPMCWAGSRLMIFCPSKLQANVSFKLNYMDRLRNSK